MLNLGIASIHGETTPVSLVDVQSAQIAYREMAQRLTDYMNFMEVVNSLKKHNTPECMAFATELLGVPSSMIKKASMEDYKTRVATEAVNVWKSFANAWTTFFKWIKDRIMSFLNLFKSKGENFTIAAQHTAENITDVKNKANDALGLIEQPSSASKTVAGVLKQALDRFAAEGKTRVYALHGKAAVAYVKNIDQLVGVLDKISKAIIRKGAEPVEQGVSMNDKTFVALRGICDKFVTELSRDVKGWKDSAKEQKVKGLD